MESWFRQALSVQVPNGVVGSVDVQAHRSTRDERCEVGRGRCLLHPRFGQ
jgi:hypothetical protein